MLQHISDESFSNLALDALSNGLKYAKNLTTYKPTDLKTYKPTSIPYSLQMGAAAAKPLPPPFGFYILIDVGLYVFRSVGL